MANIVIVIRSFIQLEDTTVSYAQFNGFDSAQIEKVYFWQNEKEIATNMLSLLYLEI